MLHLAVDVESAALRMTTSLTVLLPQAGDAADWGAPEPGPDGPPVLYLLHGLSDDASAWTRFTSIERYAAAAGLAVVMPEVGRSMYADAPGGAAYFSYVADELPQLVAGAFRVSTRRADTFVAGLSMGGYGALKLALRRPERYAAAAALSAVADVRAVESGDRFTPAQLEALFGPTRSGVGGVDDVQHTLRTAAQAGADLPALYLSCGEQDGLIDGNREFERLAGELGVPVMVDHHPGEHTWDYWDAGIQRVLAWLPR
ncbi:MAG: esterase family protein [Actinobacteria bacterium]|nr:esterase family protein [Actinomycetota bacterium]